MDFSNIMELLKPELIVLIAVTWGLGLMIKATRFDNEHIPWVTAVIIAALALIYVFATTEIVSYQLMLMAIFIGITQGIVAWLIGWKTYDKFIKNGLVENNDGKG